MWGIIIAQSAIQGVKAPCAAKAAIIPVTHGLKSKCPYGRFLFFAHDIMTPELERTYIYDRKSNKNKSNKVKSQPQY